MSYAFPARTQQFLADLRANNDRGWFEAHRDEYRAAYVEPASEFVTAAAPLLAELAPDVRAEPRVLGSIFRINRDTRFSRDKRPYKDNLDLWFWEGERRTAISGFMVRVTPDMVAIGAGAHHLSREALERFRRAVADARAGAELARIVSEVEGAGHELGEARYKRIPPGYDADGPAARFLRHDGLVSITVEAPPLATDADLLARCAAIWRDLAPMHRWLVDNVQA